MEIRWGRHVVYTLHTHLVFVTRFRRDALSALEFCDLTAIFAEVCRDFAAELDECSGGNDHVHLLVTDPPTITLSTLVNSFKSLSSRRLREMRPEVSGRYYQGVLWSQSYFVTLVAVLRSVSSPATSDSSERMRAPRLGGRGF